MMRDNQDKLGLEPLVFDLAFEGFWNLYTFHHSIDVSPKKMQTWVQTKIKLVPNALTGVPEIPGIPLEDGQEPTPANEKIEE